MKLCVDIAVVRGYYRNTTTEDIVINKGPYFATTDQLLPWLHAQGVADVRVYWNLHKDCYSVQAKPQRNAGWRVICYAGAIALRNARFLVSEAGRQRVLRDQAKNVHAYVRGEPISWSKDDHEGALRQPSYNPYRGPQFTDRSNGHKAVLSAEYVELTTATWGGPQIAATH